MVTETETTEMTRRETEGEPGGNTLAVAQQEKGGLYPKWKATVSRSFLTRANVYPRSSENGSSGASTSKCGRVLRRQTSFRNVQGLHDF